MTKREFVELIDRLRAEPEETEWLEFKSNYYESQKLGEYLSAIANSACYRRKSIGYLVFGIDNRTHEVTGTNFKPDSKKEKGKGNQPLLLWLSNGLLPNVGFSVAEGRVRGQRVVLFEISPAIDIPVKFYGTAHIRIGSAKTNLANHPEIEREIWNRRRQADWSADICEEATLEDLDSEAIQKARNEYKAKFPGKSGEVDSWDGAKFLDKVKITIRSRITNTAILLLGKPESASLIAPAVAKISWILKDEKNREKDYKHFGPPFILNVEQVFAKIRNVTLRQLPDGTLFPVEISQYDRWVFREALHNCIAHQDYLRQGRISVVEMPNRIIFANVGSFLPGDVETIIRQDTPPDVYRNPFLAETMVNLNMIDTQGGGIKRMFIKQKERFLPLPDYDLSRPDAVTVTIPGAVLDEKYSRLLMEHADLDFFDALLLDRVQKRIPIPMEEVKRLRRLSLVEGRLTRLLVAAKVAAVIGEKAKHIRHKGLERDYYKEMIVALIREHGSATREDINNLLMDKLPEMLTDQQKKSLIHNLLSNLAQSKIRNAGGRRYPKWELR